MKLTWLIAALALTALAPAGCGGRAASGTWVYFVDGHISPLGWRGKLTPIEREAVDSPREAVLVLLEGPSPSEREQGLLSAIPNETRLVRFSVSDGTATVRLSTKVPSSTPPLWEHPQMGSDGFYGTAQLVYTLTKFESIERVVLFVNGRRCCVYTHENEPVRRPLTRALFIGWQGQPTEDA